jgi:hypothetical protein
MSTFGIVAITLFPGLARYAYAPGFESPRGVAKFVLVRAALTFVAFQTHPRLVARKELWDATYAQLQAGLGRQPTPDEFWAGWREAKRRR